MSATSSKAADPKTDDPKTADAKTSDERARPLDRPRPQVVDVGFHDLSAWPAARAAAEPAGAGSMRGFDPAYRDIVDYILRSTHRIWEEKGVGLIDSHYRHNAVVHASSGTTYGREAVVAATLQTLNAFPDRRLYGQAVIWSGDDRAGFYSSHRILNTGTNRGPTAWGPATGRRAQWQGIADCFVVENRVCEEWLVRDDAHLARQLGYDLDVLARTLAAADAARGVQPEPGLDAARAPGQYARLPRPEPEPRGDPEATVAWFLDEIWNGRMLNRIADLYAADALLHGPGGRQHRGPGAIAGHALALLAAVPDAVLTIEHVNHVADPQAGTTVAVRWRLAGTHDGPGVFGPASGARLGILGISHLRLAGGRVAEEWTVFDELTVRRQIALHRG